MPDALKHSPIPRVVPAEDCDLSRYIDLLEEVADWLDARNIKQWQPGIFRSSSDYYAESLRRGEVHLAFRDDELVGTLRLLMQDPIVWPEAASDEAVYVYNLAVRRTWAGRGLGAKLLGWAADQAVAEGRHYVRLDCMAHNAFLAQYYVRAGFDERGEVDAPYPAPIGTLRLRRFERRVGLPSPIGDLS